MKRAETWCKTPVNLQVPSGQCDGCLLRIFELIPLFGKNRVKDRLFRIGLSKGWMVIMTMPRRSSVRAEVDLEYQVGTRPIRNSHIAVTNVSCRWPPIAGDVRGPSVDVASLTRLF